MTKPNINDNIRFLREGRVDNEIYVICFDDDTTMGGGLEKRHAATLLRR